MDYSSPDFISNLAKASNDPEFLAQLANTGIDPNAALAEAKRASETWAQHGPYYGGAQPQPNIGDLLVRGAANVPGYHPPIPPVGVTHVAPVVGGAGSAAVRPMQVPQVQHAPYSIGRLLVGR